MAEGQEGIVRFKALGAQGDWHRFRAVKLKIGQSLQHGDALNAA